LPVDHTVESVARAIHAVQMSAYAQEARLLGVLQFPPLARTVEDVRVGTESFLGVHVGGQLVGSVSVEPDPEYTGMSIASLTVAPAFQRRGIATALMVEVLQRHGAGCLTVQTGMRNAPALRLYERLGFVRVRRWVVGPESLEIVKLCRVPSTAQQPRAHANSDPASGSSDST
jgi:ribosomal protein S18 acetylase RimI-like enzyme